MDKVKVGEKYGKLTILENHHPKDEVVCRCECGNIKSYIPRHVTSGRTQSCGCIRREMTKMMNYKHGESKTRLYKIWCEMKRRCSKENDPVYRYYGGRGIKICQEWNDYINFRDWALSNGYNEELSLDRIDFDGDYCPENCRWADKYMQANNTRRNHFLSLAGERHTVAEWARIIGITPSSLRDRLKRLDVETALTMPRRR